MCEGTGVQRVVNRASLVPDESLTIDEGAVSPWGSLMWKLMKDVAREMGVRTNVPFRDLSDAEKTIVYEGPAEKRHIVVATKTGGAELDFTYFNAVATVEKRPVEGERREGSRPRRQVPHHPHVPGLRRHAPGGAGALHTD